MATKNDRMYTKEHEWVKVEGNVAYIGISDHAQEALGAIVFVELPAEGKVLAAGDAFAVLESVKAASSVYTPVAGRVVSANRALDPNPELLNDAPYEQHIVAIEMSGSLPSDLMDAAAYDAFVASEG